MADNTFSLFTICCTVPASGQMAKALFTRTVVMVKGERTSYICAFAMLLSSYPIVLDVVSNLYKGLCRT
jgi:hypothetical protein